VTDMTDMTDMTDSIPVFLDIDGVLQSAASVMAGTPIVHSHDLPGVQRMKTTQATALLLRVQNLHEPRIHWWIASSWCNHNHPDELCEAFTALGFKNVHTCASGHRLTRVQKVLAGMTPEKREAAIIIDDSAAFRGTELEGCWIDIDARNGFDGTAYYQMLHMLGVSKPELFLW